MSELMVRLEHDVIDDTPRIERCNDGYVLRLPNGAKMSGRNIEELRQFARDNGYEYPIPSPDENEAAQS